MNQEIKKRIEDINNGIVPEGYKGTEFGIFPSDWETSKRLGNIGIWGKGKGLPGNKITSEGVPCVGYGDIYMKYNNFHFEQAQTFVDQQTANESQPIKKGTLLFTGTGETAEEIGKCVCYNGDETIYTGGDIILFNSKEVNPLFLAYQQYQPFSLKKKASLGQGHSVVHIHSENLDKLYVAYPKSTEEQAKIAEILMKWDEAVELQEQYIQKLELRKKAIMQKLLTPKDSWKCKKLGVLCDVRTGNKNTQDANKKGRYPFYVRSPIVERIDTYSFDGEAILIPGDGNIGKIFHYINGKFEYHQRVYKISDAKNIKLLYIFYYLQENLRQRVMSLSAKATVDSLRLEMLTEMDIYYNKENVDKTVVVLSKTDEEISLQKEKLSKIKKQRKAMQQYLLTGIVRVVFRG